MKKISVLILALIAALSVSACGKEEENQDGKEVSAKPEQVSSATSLNMVRAHQMASLVLYEDGRRKEAEKHAGHPVEELFFSISRSLRSKNAELTAELRDALKEPSRLIYKGAQVTELKNSYRHAEELLDRAEADLVPESVRESTSFKGQLVAGLLEKVEEEYSEAVENGAVKKKIEYQDTWGALEQAENLFDSYRSSFGEEATEIEKQIDGLKGVIPSIEPAKKPASVETVEGYVDGAVLELNEAAGGTVEKSDPVEELGEVQQALTEVETTYASGNKQEAEELATEAYLEHFEKIEPALAKADKELMEEIEVALATTLRESIRSGAANNRIEAQVAKIKENIEEAELALKGDK